MKQTITGVFNILATPFMDGDAVDVASLRRLVDFQIACGVYGLTILGVLGEAAKLSVDERHLVLETVMATTAGRVPVVVGTSHAQPDVTLELTRAAFAAGASGVMIAPPYFDDPTPAAIQAFYERMASACSGTLVVQDYPVVTNAVLTPDLLAAIAEAIPQAHCLKLEDPPLMQKIGAIRARTDKFAIFGGLGGMFFLEELRRGCAGTMTGFAFSEVLVAVYKAFCAGQHDEAERVFDRYLPLIRFENQPLINLSIRKALLSRRGAIADARLRPPFTPIDAATHDEIDWMLRRVGIHEPTGLATV